MVNDYSMAFLSFPFCYGCLDVKGKIVIDVGGYNGDTASFFLKRGAAKVIVFEADDGKRAEIEKKFANNPAVEVYGAWTGEALPTGDVLKMDIEGAEKYLTEEMLTQYSQFVVGLHPTKLTEEDYVRLHGLIEKCGGHLNWLEGTEYVYTNNKVGFRPYYLIVLAAAVGVVCLFALLSKSNP